MCLLVETLRSKLVWFCFFSLAQAGQSFYVLHHIYIFLFIPFMLQEDTRQKLVVSDNKVRQLETQVHQEKLTNENGMKVIR